GVVRDLREPGPLDRLASAHASRKFVARPLKNTLGLGELVSRERTLEYFAKQLKNPCTPRLYEQPRHGLVVAPRNRNRATVRTDASPFRKRSRTLVAKEHRAGLPSRALLGSDSEKNQLLCAQTNPVGVVEWHRRGHLSAVDSRTVATAEIDERRGR